MAALREMGLTAALLAATGGAALATWSYFSARRRKKAAARDPQAEYEGGEVEADLEPAAEEQRVSADIPSQQVAEERAGAGPHSRHDTALTPEAAPPVQAAGLPHSHERDTVTVTREPPLLKEVSTGHSSAHSPPQAKTPPCKQVIVLGLDGSGKTSVLNSMAANKGNMVTTPTGGVNALCVNDGNSKMEFLEIGGSEQLRPYWKMYLSKAFAIIFVVDAADHSRLPLAKRHLHQLIQQDAVLPLIVLANKQDLENAYHITEIHDALALSEICENRKLFLIGTHVTNRDSEISTGIQDAKEYLVQLFSEHSV